MNKLVLTIFIFLLFSISTFAITIDECDGCIMGDKCLNFEVRRAGLFCDADGSVEQQKIKEDICVEDYQCRSNSCVSGVCEGLSFLGGLKEGFSDIYTTITNSDDGVQIISYADTADGLSANFSLKDCDGCYDDDGKCVGLTYRNSGKFCDTDHIFKKQFKGGTSCLANHECKSNECMRNNKCKTSNIFRTLFLWIDGNN